MLRFRENQMMALADANLLRFIVANIPHFREIAPEQTKELDDDALADLVTGMAHDAHGFGIELADHLRRYLGAALLLGSDYVTNTEHAELVDILRDPGVGPDIKLDQIDDYLVFRG